MPPSLVGSVQSATRRRPSLTLEADRAIGAAPSTGQVSVLRQWIRNAEKKPEKASSSARLGSARLETALLIDYWEIKIEELQKMAIARGLKREGDSWRKACGPMGNRANISKRRAATADR